MNILIVSYQISPYRGSEYSVGWNHVVNISKNHNLKVIYGASGDNLADNIDIPNWLKNNNLSNVEFDFLEPNKFILILNYLNKIGIWKYSFYLAYYFWHLKLYYHVKSLLKKDKIDIIHFLNPIGYREPGFLWILRKPYIWGPVGGVSNYPLHLIDEKLVLERFKMTMFNLLNNVQFNFNIRLKKAISNSTILLASTKETRREIGQVYKREVNYLPENALLDESITCDIVRVKSGDPLKIVWIGNIVKGKNLVVLLQALEPLRSLNWELHVIGDGPLSREMKSLSKYLGLNSQIFWHGLVNRKKVLLILCEMHLHVVTSLREGNPTVLWEAMSFNIPSIALDHFGMGDVICSKCGIKINTRSRSSVISDITKNLLYILNDTNYLTELSIGVSECRKSFLWSSRVAEFDKIYNEAFKLHHAYKR